MGIGSFIWSTLQSCSSRGPKSYQKNYTSNVCMHIHILCIMWKRDCFSSQSIWQTLKTELVLIVSVFVCVHSFLDFQNETWYTLMYWNWTFFFSFSATYYTNRIWPKKNGIELNEYFTERGTSIYILNSSNVAFFFFFTQLLLFVCMCVWWAVG